MILCNKPQTLESLLFALLGSKYEKTFFCERARCVRLTVTVCWHLRAQTKEEFTSVCRMAARCSLAVRDSLSTSICCLQSEFWLFRVSSFVWRANSSDSFLDSSCFSWSICRYKKQSAARHINSVMFCYHGVCVTQRRRQKPIFTKERAARYGFCTIFINALFSH